MLLCLNVFVTAPFSVKELLAVEKHMTLTTMLLCGCLSVKQEFFFQGCRATGALLQPFLGPGAVHGERY